MDPTFAQYPEHDAQVSGWMAAQGWPVTLRVYDFEREVFAWRHGAGSAARTLRVTQAAVDDTPPGVLRSLLDAARVAGAMDRSPGAYVVVGVEPGTGAVGVQMLEAPPG